MAEGVVVYFQREHETGYEATTGAVYEENYSEELDNFSLVVKQVGKKLDIRPYDIAKVYYPQNQSVEMFVDTIHEKRTRSFNSSYLYDYTITLMSETKYLEKIQLPNRSFTGVIGGSGRSALSVMEELIDQYMPRIVYRSNGGYQTIFFISLNKATRNKFGNLYIKDLTLSKPTLRQALTAVMSQFGCIPVVKDRSLGFIDFNESPKYGSETRIDPNIIIYEDYSNASDSYVNTLVSNATNVLDDTNPVKEKFVGFRNRDEGILKQDGNLKLYTSLPIYKIDNVIMYYLRRKIVYKQPETPIANPTIIQGIPTKRGDTFTIPLNPFSGSLKNVSCEVRTYGYEVIDGTLYSSTLVDQKVGVVTLENNNTQMRIVASGLKDGQYFNIGIKYILRDADGYQYYYYSNAPSYDFIYLYRNADITPLVQEAGRRKMLSYDYRDIPNNNVAELAKYYYTTVEYKIGGNEITGWSTTYNEAQGWWGWRKTVTENIVDKLFKNDYYQSDAEQLKRIYCFPSWAKVQLTSFGGNGSQASYESSGEKIVLRIDTGLITNEGNYVYNCMFDISYFPLNQINYKTYKTGFDDCNFPLEQLDSKENGVVSFDALTAVEGDKIRRLGNGLRTVMTRVSNLSMTYPLGWVESETGYQIFKRSIVFKNNYYDVTYYLCKDYAMTNYSTAITTKYRAYQYIDYSQATERIENITYHFHISKERKIDSGFKYYMIKNGASLFFENNDGNQYIGFIEKGEALKYDDGGSSNIGRRNFLNGVSFMSSSDSFCINYKSYDTVSMGNFIEATERNGGIPQHQYMAKQESDYTFRTYYLGFIVKESNDQYIKYMTENSNFLNFPLFDLANNIVDSKKAFLEVYPMVQDQSELMGYTVQFALHSDTPDFICTRYMETYNKFNLMQVSNIFCAFPSEPITRLSEHWDERLSGTGNIKEINDNIVISGDGTINVIKDIVIGRLDLNGTRKSLCYFKAGTYYVNYAKNVSNFGVWILNGKVIHREGD